MKRYKVDVSAEWTVELEADNTYDAEVFAEDMVEGQYSWAIRPNWIDAFATELNEEETGDNET